MGAVTERSSPTDTAPHTTVGADLRALRRARGLTLTEVAERIDRSVGLVSQIERGKSEPSIGDLRKLAALYGVSLGFFFANDEAPSEEAGIVVRGGARRSIGTREDGLIEELLSPDLSGSFEIIHSTFAAGAELNEPTVRQTEEAGFVVSGTFDIEVQGKWLCLAAGDSFRLSGQPFRWRNQTDTDAVVIWVIAPPVY